jgi:hypothetical protein
MPTLTFFFLTDAVILVTDGNLTQRKSVTTFDWQLGDLSTYRWSSFCIWLLPAPSNKGVQKSYVLNPSILIHRVKNITSHPEFRTLPMSKWKTKTTLKCSARWAVTKNWSQIYAEISSRSPCEKPVLDVHSKISATTCFFGGLITIDLKRPIRSDVTTSIFYSYGRSSVWLTS